MNQKRRKQLEKAAALIEEARGIMEEASGDEQEAFDNLPESLQAGERGEAMEEAVEKLTDADTHCEEMMDILTEVTEQ